MESSIAVPLAVSILVGFLLGLVTLGLVRLRPSPIRDSLHLTDDAVLLGLLTLAALTLGAFLTYVLFGFVL